MENHGIDQERLKQEHYQLITRVKNLEQQTQQVSPLRMNNDSSRIHRCALFLPFMDGHRLLFKAKKMN